MVKASAVYTLFNVKTLARLRHATAPPEKMVGRAVGGDGMRKLEWGQTPWDQWTREELLYEVRRMYSALVSLTSAARVDMYSDPYWTEGMGGAALEKTRQIFVSLHKQYSSEDIYRSFFRYALVLKVSASRHRFLAQPTGAV